jgi:bisphosphoglycerate-independent phosphoglycerate mutase (AlkP superfamily)
MSRPKPLVLIILDGWGYRAESKANAIALARKPTYDRLLREYPNTLIHTSGQYVGLPDNQMGNSEVGHLNIGAGRIVHMDSTRIELMIQNGEFFSHPVLLAAMKNARTDSRQLHLFGLLSDGGVHSYQTHLYALLKMAKQQGVERVFIHAFMDGRDTLPTNGAGYLEQLQQKMREYNCGQVATVSGRYYAMDRDRRWERIAKAFNAMVFGEGEGGKYVDPVQGMKDFYNKGVTDEFVVPFVCTDTRGGPLPTVRDNDSCICFNFRADRVAVVKATEDGTFDVIIVNFANADMVGHSGKIEPTVKAVETVDACLARVESAVRAKGGAILITADHGNAELMIDPATGGPHTAHTTNPVPFIVVAENASQFTLKPGGSLRDISPTLLGMLGLDEPKEMTGTDLRMPGKSQ